MYGSQFDGNAAFSGGGFMPSQATQAPDPSVSPAKSRDVQVLLPLTVKQINDGILSSDEKLNIVVDGVEVNNVTLVGKVCNRTDKITDVTFVLDDGTGRIDCGKWFNDAVDTNETEGILDGIYVRVHGHLKSFQGKKTLNVFSIRALTDFNEISGHFIECMYVNFYNTRLQKQRSGAATQPHMMASAPTTPLKGNQATSSNQYAGQYNGNGWKGIEQMILEFLQHPSCNNDKGGHRDVIAQNLGVPLNKLMLAIKNLEEEGLVYSTTDEYHFKSTANG